MIATASSSTNQPTSRQRSSWHAVTHVEWGEAFSALVLIGRVYGGLSCNNLATKQR